MPVAHLHTSRSVEHYTPAHVVAAARAVLGAIDLDPASCAEANETVRAERYLTTADNGLCHYWSGRVFLNPPGGTVDAATARTWGSRSSAVCWWRKLMYERGRGRVQAAVFVGFTLEILRSTQGHARFPSALGFPLCVPSQRLRFSDGSGRTKAAPPHANVIVGVGIDARAFCGAFNGIGECRTGCLPDTQEE